MGRVAVWASWAAACKAVADRWKRQGATADFSTWAATICGPKQERRKEIPFYFQKAFSWETK
jgi:hypothetical protein